LKNSWNIEGNYFVVVEKMNEFIREVMILLPKDLKYTPEHEWVKIQGDRVTMGITDYAQKELGDVVFVDLPSIGDKIAAKDPIATIESVKAVSEIYAPISGEVMEINDSLEHSPEFVNQDPYGKGWVIIIEPSDPKEIDELLTPVAYSSIVGAKE
jgi:glycine cleavage system H protein